MPPPVVNLVHSLPALDMSLALLLELRSKHPDRPIISVLKLGHATRIPSVDFLFETMCRVSDSVVLFGSSPLYADLERVASGLGVAVERLHAWLPPKIAPGLNRLLWFFKSRNDREELARFVASLPDGAILLRSHADVDQVAEAVVAAIRRDGGTSFACLEGCYPPRNALPMAYFDEPRVDLCDRFLLYSEGHRRVLAQAGYTSATVIGYTKLYPAWRENIEKNAAVLELCEESERFTVSVFTRGETPGGGPQIMPDSVFEPLLEDLLAALDERIDAPRVLIKPHPAQDVALIERVAASRSSIKLTTLHPSQLAAISDLVVTTWSTSTVDALAFDVPCIEYFRPNGYFLSVYPNGSSFRQLGIQWAEDGDGFRHCLDEVLSGSYELPDVERVFEHRMDLSVFE
jgi:hypothetical protein